MSVNETIPFADLLRLLSCPQCLCPVVPADKQLLVRINQALEDGTLKNMQGAPVSSFDGVLVCQNSRHLFPVRNNVPALLISETMEIK